MAPDKNERGTIILMEPPQGAREKRIGRQVIPNIGLAYVAAVLERAGYDVVVLDTDAEAMSDEDCVAIIADKQPLAVGLSSMTHNVTDAGRFASAVRKRFPKMPVVLGGGHATAIPERTMREFPDIDYCVAGEAEHSSVQLFDYIASCGDVSPQNIEGVAFRNGSEIGFTPPVVGGTDLDSIPAPAWGLFNLESYTSLFVRHPGKNQLPIMTSRGCPYKCVFCNNFNGHVIRFRNPDLVLDEIGRGISEHKAGSLQFVDEALTIRKKHAEKIFHGMLERGYAPGLKWICQTRIDSLDPELLALMKESGCVYMSVGIESGNQDILDKTGKKLKLDRVRQAEEWIHEAGIDADVLFLIGMPYETQDTIIDTIKFARSLKARSATFSNMVPFPGTKVFEMAEKGEGGLRLLSTDWSKYSRYFDYVMELETVSVSRLKLLHIMAYLIFFMKPGRMSEFFKRVNIFRLPSYLFNVLFKK